MLGAFGGLVDGGGDLVEGGSRLLKAGGLLLGPAREVVGGAGDLFGARADGLCIGADGDERGLKRVHGSVEVGAKHVVLGRKRFGQPVRDVAVRKGPKSGGQGLDDVLLRPLAMAPVLVRAATLVFCRRDIDCKLDDLEGRAVPAKQRIVGGLDPDLPAALGDPLELGGDELAAVQPVPERAVIVAADFCLIDEHAVVLADHLLFAVAECRQEVLIGGQDRAIEFELDHGLRPTDSGNLGLQFGQLLGCLVF